MKCNVLEYLEAAARNYPHKVAFSDGEKRLTFSQLLLQSKTVGCFLSYRKYHKRPILVLMSRSPEMVAAFFSVLYSGNYYIPVEEEMSISRIGGIVEKASPSAIICDEKTEKTARSLGFEGEIYLYSGLVSRCEDAVTLSHEDAALLSSVRKNALDSDPAYIVFTSGSTGSPKGVVGCHRNLIDYMEALDEVLNVSANTVFGMQAPLYVDACLKEILLTIKKGAATVLIPRGLFSFPVRLVEFMNAQGINAVCWAASALTMVSSLRTLDVAVPNLGTVVFGGEVFSAAQLELWRRALPSARFINLYGLTECTGMSCYYEIEKGSPLPIEYELGIHQALGCCEIGKGTPLPGPIPIGKAFSNTEVFLFGEDGHITAPGIPGELYIRGACVTLGYYNDPERTAEVFVQNPLHSAYPEIVCRTGDLAKYNADGELVFICRKDYQIKHRGYRIELMEIESVAARFDGVLSACCTFDEGRDRIILYYVGIADEKPLAAYLRNELPRYMVPHDCIVVDELPCTPNGKLDRALVTKGEWYK